MISTAPPALGAGVVLVGALAAGDGLLPGPTGVFFSGGLVSFVARLLNDFFYASGFFSAFFSSMLLKFSLLDAGGVGLGL
jgi:hypothetical protein